MVDSSELMAAIDRILQQVADQAARETNERRNPKPRYTERDREIIRLRDVEGMPGKQIGRRLKEINGEWSGPGGKPLSDHAVRRAYVLDAGAADMMTRLTDE